VLTVIAVCLALQVLGVGRQVDRFQGVITERAALRIDSATGKAWLSGGTTWTPIEEPVLPTRGVALPINDPFRPRLPTTR